MADWEKVGDSGWEKIAVAPKDAPKDQKLPPAYPDEPIYEAMMSFGSGMVGTVAGEVAGLGAIPLHAAGAIQTEPQQVATNVREAMTVKPRTQQGEDLTKAFNTIGDWWSRIAGAAERIVAPPETSGPGRAMLGYATKGLVEQAPQLLGGKMPEAAASASKTLRTGAERSMQKALRPTLAEVHKGQDVTAINTMLEQGLNVTHGGLSKIQDRVANLNTEISTLIQNSPAKIDKNAAAAYAQDAVNTFRNQVDNLNDLAAIEKVYNNFLTSNASKIPVQQAQAIKSGTYSQLRQKSYGELKSAEVEAQKAIARGIKDKIAEAVPEVRPLNAEESKLLTALPMVERRVLQDANRHLVGFGWLTTNPTHFAAWMADRSPLFWSLVGRMMDKASKVPSGKSGPAVGTGISTTAQAAEDRRRLRMERARQRQEEQ